MRYFIAHGTLFYKVDGDKHQDHAYKRSVNGRWWKYADQSWCTYRTDRIVETCVEVFELPLELRDAPEYSI